ncbi:hypothetical protein BUE76_00635 [Cnuella takakiae]|nr:hypothetical protein BUE76_00635 [Cnuella takakiae]
MEEIRQAEYCGKLLHAISWKHRLLQISLTIFGCISSFRWTIGLCGHSLQRLPRFASAQTGEDLKYTLIFSKSYISA